MEVEKQEETNPTFNEERENEIEDKVREEEEDESEDIPEPSDDEEIEEQAENPFGFLFCPSVTKCFAQTVTEDEIVFFSGNEYKGEIKEGIIHGYGTYKWSEIGAEYTGTFNWGTLTGTGQITWKDGSTYVGTVVNGIRSGRGKYVATTPRKFVYEGEWSNGLFHGEGVCWYGDEGCQNKYVGQFSNGLREGYGVMNYPGGNVYEGEWHLGKRHGKGKFLWKDSGSYYVGEFVDGQMCGKGEIVYAFSAQSPSIQFVQSNRYLGEFKDSLRSGKGTFYYANGAVYKGEWERNLKNGTGTFTSRDGRVYNSEFKDGSIYQDGQLFVPTPSISLSFPLDGLLARSESSDEVMNSLCNIYVRFLPKLRSLYQQYSRIQWAEDKTITALRMIGMWRFLQDKGTILDPEFRLCDADDIIDWNLEKPSSKSAKYTRDDPTKPSALLASTYCTPRMSSLRPEIFENSPLEKSPDPFATLFLYQLFESLVRLAHHKLRDQFPDSLILQVTRFLENLIFVDDLPAENKYSQFRKSISYAEFDDAITKVSQRLLDLYLDYSGFASGCSLFQTRQLDTSIELDSNVDVTIVEYHGLMTVRDFILFLSSRGFFDSNELTVMDILLFIKYSGVSRELRDEEEEEFSKFFTSFMSCRITFVEFVQALVWTSHLLIKNDWTMLMKFDHLIEHLDYWESPPLPPPKEEEECAEEEEKAEVQ